MSNLYEFVNGIELNPVYICNPDKCSCRSSELCYKPGGCFYTTDKDHALDPSTPLYMAVSLKKVDKELPAVKLHNLRAEVEALNPVDYVSMSSYEGHKGASDMKDDVLQIIDNLRAEIDASCEDAISRKAALEKAINVPIAKVVTEDEVICRKVVFADDIENLPPVAPEQIGRCKDCKFFEYDRVAKVDEIPLIIAHEICKKWGDGCKTKEDGYCFLFEPRERSDHESTT